MGKASTVQPENPSAASTVQPSRLPNRLVEVLEPLLASRRADIGPPVPSPEPLPDSGAGVAEEGPGPGPSAGEGSVSGGKSIGQRKGAGKDEQSGAAGNRSRTRSEKVAGPSSSGKVAPAKGAGKQQPPRPRTRG